MATRERDRDKDLVRQVDGVVVGDIAPGESFMWRLLGACEIRCQRGGRLHDALECISCPRFVNFVPSADRTRMRIRCSWTEDDCVGGIMTMASEIVSVMPGTKIAPAVTRARAANLHHLLVTENDEVVGIVCRCALMPPVHRGETIADRMSTTIYSVRPWDTIEKAVALMAEQQVGCLPVLSDTTLYGILSRSDLLGAGVGPTRFGVKYCENCGNHHALRQHPEFEQLTYCVDCLEEGLSVEDYVEVD